MSGSIYDHGDPPEYPQWRGRSTSAESDLDCYPDTEGNSHAEAPATKCARCGQPWSHHRTGHPKQAKCAGWAEPGHPVPAEPLCASCRLEPRAAGNHLCVRCATDAQDFLDNQRFGAMEDDDG